MTNTSSDQFDKKDDRKESAAYNGNWGYAPGNGMDPNDEWGSFAWIYGHQLTGVSF
jgi:hypothetical protein